MSSRTVHGLALATTVLAPLGAQAAPANAVAKAEARYEVLLAGGATTANAPSTDYETTVISIGEVIGAGLALPSLNCPVPGTFCIFGGTAADTAIASNGHVRVEAGIGPFRVDFTMLSPGSLIVNALIEDEFTIANLGAPGGEASASVAFGDFTLTGLGGEPAGFGVDPGAPASFGLPVGVYTLTWSGLDTAAEAKLLGDAIPAPASSALLGVALAGLALAQSRHRFIARR